MIDWTAFGVSLRLAAFTVVILIPISLMASRHLAFRVKAGKSVFEAIIALPLVLPPTVLGFYLLTFFAGGSLLGRTWFKLFGHSLAFDFDGLLAASIIVNIPFAVQPLQRAFEAIPRDVREAARVCGLSPWRAFLRIELPLAWPGLLSAFAFIFAHTMGEFGVVLMVGGNIPGHTRTAALAIYDRTQAFDTSAAGAMSALLLLLSVIAIGVAYGATSRFGRRNG